jgi:hypothetical protein
MSLINTRQEKLQSFYQNSKRDRAESYFERYYRNGSSPWFREIGTVVSINRIRTGHSSLKVNLSRFNIVSTAECECGDGLQMEEHIFWHCKRYQDIFSENSKKTKKKQKQSQLKSS